MKIITPGRLLLFIVVVFAGCKTKEKQSVWKELDTWFASQFKPAEPGASVLISLNDSVVFQQSYGTANLATQEPITAQTLFNLGSISKTFVAYGILVLRDEGKLSLEDPLEKYFTDFKNSEIARKVHIIHLLTHTSGLPDLRRVKEDSVFYLTAKDEENWAPVMQADSLSFEPGSQFAYSNPAFNALALIIEKVSGQKWQDFIHERIFLPAGMNTSTITDGPHPESGVAHGYVYDQGRWIEKDYGEEPTFAAAGNGGVWSSVDDLVKYEKALREATFLSEQTITKSQQPFLFNNWSADFDPYIGLSWFIRYTANGLKIVEHTGTQGGFYCHHVSVPEKRFLYIILANRPFDREKTYEKVLSLFFKQ